MIYGSVMREYIGLNFSESLENQNTGSLRKQCWSIVPASSSMLADKVRSQDGGRNQHGFFRTLQVQADPGSSFLALELLNPAIET
jgi:hypothetical protein